MKDILQNTASSVHASFSTGWAMLVGAQWATIESTLYFIYHKDIHEGTFAMFYFQTWELHVLAMACHPSAHALSSLTEQGFSLGYSL